METRLSRRGPVRGIGPVSRPVYRVQKPQGAHVARASPVTPTASRPRLPCGSCAVTGRIYQPHNHLYPMKTLMPASQARQMAEDNLAQSVEALTQEMLSLIADRIAQAVAVPNAKSKIVFASTERLVQTFIAHSAVASRVKLELKRHGYTV